MTFNALMSAAGRARCFVFLPVAQQCARHDALLAASVADGGSRTLVAAAEPSDRLTRLNDPARELADLRAW